MRVLIIRIVYYFFKNEFKFSYYKVISPIKRAIREYSVLMVGGEYDITNSKLPHHTRALSVCWVPSHPGSGDGYTGLATHVLQSLRCLLGIILHPLATFDKLTGASAFIEHQNYYPAYRFAMVPPMMIQIEVLWLNIEMKIQRNWDLIILFGHIIIKDISQMRVNEAMMI